MTGRRAGFTVIEVLVAITVMAIALSGIASTAVMTMRADTRGHQTSAATVLAQAKLEKLRAIPRSSSEWTEGSHLEAGLNEAGQPSASGRFSRQWMVDHDYNSQPDLDRVTVTVSWNDGRTHAVVMSALYW